ncbi:hypothetical protein TSH64_01225 [Azospirillum sp. TSH64]|nr:hypothetical protein TSH64_01225 [Azospirillum sp. TSH64]
MRLRLAIVRLLEELRNAPRTRVEYTNGSTERVLLERDLEALQARADEVRQLLDQELPAKR